MHGFEDVAEQALMVLDEIRVKAFAEAIRKVVRPGDIVADIGTGNGILAVLAAQSGAGRVFAVERSAIADLAGRVVRDNDLESVVQVIRADARDAVFPQPPTVLVSEMLGSFAVDEDIVGVMKVVQRKCARDVRVIPRGFEVFLAPLHDERLAGALERLHDVFGVRMDEVRTRMVHRPLGTRIRVADLMGEGVGTGTIELPQGPSPERFRATLAVTRPGDVNAIGAWFRADLADGVALSTGPHDPPTHWFNRRLPVDPPLRCDGGATLEVQVEPGIGGGSGIWRWWVSAGGQTREGSELGSSGGDHADLARQLGFRLLPREDFQPSAVLQAWTAILQGRIEGSVPEMAGRLLRARPDRYADLEDARDEVIRLLRASESIP